MRLTCSIDQFFSISVWQQQQQQQQHEKQLQEKPTTTEGAAAELDEDETPVDANDTDMLNSLTGCPVEEDEILFALPVVAPYNALHNYK